jgi:magnesium and cobalt transporter
MADTDSGAADGVGGLDDGESESTARQGLLARLFRRDVSEDDPESRDKRDAAASAGASKMILNVRRLRGMRVEEVCVPRAEIISVSDEATLDEVVAVFQSSTMTRLPVHSGGLDQPRGLVHLKDLALRYGFGAGNGDFDINELLRPLLYVPPSMPIGVLLQKMQAGRIHMALVIDEYGGVDGLVTIEDLIEQIVGEIGDEHDEEDDQLWSRESENVYLVQARLDLEEFEDEIGVKLVKDEFAEEVDTLGGLLFRLAGRVPVRGEVIIHPDGHEFEVLDADARKVKRLRIRVRHAGHEQKAAAAE